MTKVQWDHFVVGNSCTGDTYSLRWRHNGRDSVSNHQLHGCLLNRLFRRRSKKTSKLRVTGLCARNSPGTSEFPAQMASTAHNVSIWWRHHVHHIEKVNGEGFSEHLEDSVTCYLLGVRLVYSYQLFRLYPLSCAKEFTSLFLYSFIYNEFI